MNDPLGINDIGIYISDKMESNFDLKEKFEIDDKFITEKLGIATRAIARSNESASDMCVKAFENLKKTSSINIEDIEVIIVVTQNPDHSIPHSSAILHEKIGASSSCACFDISLGCSGYVYGLSNIISFMQFNNMSRGLLFTSDPYSKVMNHQDKNTKMLFGDAATVTFVDNNPKYVPIKFTFGTDGSKWENLTTKNGLLEMNGRAIFNFAAKMVPKDILSLLESEGIQKENVDKFFIHQGSKLIVDTIKRRLELGEEQVDYDIYDYGNTVSSSIPILMKNYINSNLNTFLLSGFGVGLSWSSSILQRVR